MRALSLISISALSLGVGCTDRDLSLAGACDGADCIRSDFGPAPELTTIQRLFADSVRTDATLDAAELSSMVAFTRSEPLLDGPATDLVLDLAASASLTPEADRVFSEWVDGVRTGHLPLDNHLYRVVPGTQPNFVFDDAFYLIGEGSFAGGTGLRSHSRGYAKRSAGVLFRPHGSVAPHHANVSSVETDRLRAQAPSAALDRAAETAGLDLGDFNTFDYVARNVHYDPRDTTPSWAGLCHAWSYTALDDRINVLVDVPGDPGRAGLWIFGEWVSRADLGNQMMGVANALSVADANLVDNFMLPEDLFLGIAEHVFDAQVGLRADVWNDEAEGERQVWNQPVVSATVTVENPSDPALDAAVLAFSRKDTRRWKPVPDGSTVRLVRLTAKWGAETRDDWEGAPVFGESRWNIYFLVDGNQRVVAGYMASELAAGGVAGLPERSSDALPDYIAFPRHQLVGDALAGRSSSLLDGASDGPRFRFLVGTALALGIPERTRASFEAEVAAGGADPEVLARRYPGVANAYRPDQWAALFAPTLGDGSAFGAAW
jgi:hypothetical protein